jgi:ribosomal protein S27AE
VIGFLARTPTEWFCDGCIALDIKVSLEEARAVMAELSADRRVNREQRECSRCGRSVSAARVESRSAA